MDMISYWSNGKGGSPTAFYKSPDITLIYGFYDQDNSGNANKAIGIYWWSEFPSARGKLAPCVLPPYEAKCFLQGLLSSLLKDGKYSEAKGIVEALEFLCNNG